MTAPARLRALVVDEALAPATSAFRRLAGIVRASRRIRLCLGALLVVDVAFILFFGIGKMAHELAGYTGQLYTRKELLITTDGGLPEWLGYFQFLAIILLFLRSYRSTREPVYLGWSLLYLVVLLDDSMTIHENGGVYLAYVLHLPSILGVRPREVGEVLTWILLGLALGPLWIGSHFRSSREHRGYGLAFVPVFSALVFFGMFVDQLYTDWNTALHGAAGPLLDVCEDGGEMISITCTLALALALEVERRRRLESRR